MGCRICVAGRWEEEVQRRRSVNMGSNARTNFCKQSISRCSVWGKFQYLEAGDFRNLKQRLAAHAASDFHRLCADVFNSPRFLLAPLATQNLKAHSDVEQKASSSKQELIGCLDAVAATSAVQSPGQPAAPSEPGQPAAPSQETLRSSVGTLDLAIGSIQDPFRGNLPQREDWVEVWVESTCAIAFRKQEAVKEKRAAPQIERRRKREMVAVEAEVVRERCRTRLREAT